MSRIGKQPIIIPEGVEFRMEDDTAIIKGPKGELRQTINHQIELSLKDTTDEQGKKYKELTVKPKKKIKGISAFWGLTRALLANMVKGVTEGFEKKLELAGVGYRVSLEGKNLVLNIGLSHPVKLEAPEGIEFSVEKNIITVAGFDKQLVGQIAAKIRSYKKPEPYKGKGIHYLGEVIRRKSGKKAVGAE